MKVNRWLPLGVLTISLGLVYMGLAQAPSAALPMDVFKRVVAHDAKFVQQAVAKDKLDKKTGRKVKAAALMIAHYAQSKMSGSKGYFENLYWLREDAIAVIKAVDADNLAEARKHAAALHPEREVVAPARPGAKTALNTLLDFEFVMRMFSSERIGGFGMEKELEDLVETKTPLPADKQQKTVDLAYKWAMIASLAESYPPEKDEPKGKTRKNWMTFAEQLRSTSQALAEAAKMNRDVGAAANAVSSACTKCHNIFRLTE